MPQERHLDLMCGFPVGLICTVSTTSCEGDMRIIPQSIAEQHLETELSKGDEGSSLAR